MAVPAVEVLLLVDDGVELALGAHRHQAELARGRREGGERRHLEVGLPIAGREGRRVQDAAGDVELAPGLVDLADGRIAGDHLGHLLPQALVRAEGGPVEPSGRQEELGERGDDLDLGAEVAVHRRLTAFGEPHEVEHRLLRRALRLLVAGEHGQDDRRLAAAVDVALVQLGGEGDGERQAAQRGAGPRAIGVAGEEIAAEQHGRPHAALGGGGHGCVGVEAGGARRRDPVELLHPGGERSLQLGRDADRADALHVRVAADREEPRARPPEPAARQREVRERQHVVDAMHVVGEPHRPEQDAAPRANQHGHRARDLRARHARRVEQCIPRRRGEVGLHRLPAAGVRGDEVPVDAAGLDDALQQGLEERHVGADVRLEVEVGDGRADEHAPPVRRHPEADETQLAQRVDDDHAAAAAPERHELRHEPRMVAPGVRAGDEGEVRRGHVVEPDGRRPRAVDLAERHARGVVAVEGAVVDVRRAPGTRHHLHQERRLVARPSRRVEERLLRPRLAEPGRRPVERLAPRHPPEVRVTRAGDDRKDETAEAFELARAEPLEARERCRPEEVLRDRAGHIAGLRLHGLLADLGEVADLVPHAAELPAHPEPARLARVARTQPAVEAEEAARLAPLAEDVGQRGQAAARADTRASHAGEARSLGASAARPLSPRGR